MKKIKAMVQQGVDVVLFQSGQFRNTIAFVETGEGCPLQPGSSLQKVMYMVPNLAANMNRSGIAVEGDVKHQEMVLASTTLYEQKFKISLKCVNYFSLEQNRKPR